MPHHGQTACEDDLRAIGRSQRSHTFGTSPVESGRAFLARQAGGRTIAKGSSDVPRGKHADVLASFLERVNWDLDGRSQAEESAFFRLPMDLGRAVAGREAAPVVGKPVPVALACVYQESNASWMARILGRDLARPRKDASSHFIARARLWLDSTEWKLESREAAANPEDAVQGAVEAKSLEAAESPRFRKNHIAAGPVLGIAASNFAALTWEQSKIGAHIASAVDVPGPGECELLVAFLLPRVHLNRPDRIRWPAGLGSGGFLSRRGDVDRANAPGDGQTGGTRAQPRDRDHQARPGVTLRR